MAFQAVPNTVQVDVVFLLFGQRVENVYHVNYPSGVDAATLVDTRDTFIEWLTGAWLPSMANDLQLIEIDVTNLSFSGGSMLAWSPPTTMMGGAASGSEPGNVSFCVSARTGASGRSFRGRKYVAGVPTSVRTGNTASSDWVATLTTALNALITLLGDVNGLLVVVSRISEGVERLEGIVTEIISWTASDLFLDSQRRRLTGRGT